MVHEGKRCGVDQERGAEAAEVVEMLNGVHAEAREWLNVGVPVVKAVDVLVHGRDVDKSKAFQLVSKSRQELRVTCGQNRSETLYRGEPRRLRR